MSKPSPKPALKPAILHTREAMHMETSQYVHLKLQHLALTAEMEQEKAAIEKRYTARLNKIASDIELSFAAVQNFCTLHRAEVLEGKLKSFTTASATIGFRDTPPKVEKVRSKETWEGVATRLNGLVFTVPEDDALPPDQRRPLLDCSTFVRESKPEVNKDALLAARGKLTEEQLKAMGIRFESEELFYIDPKSEIVEGETEAA